jgi:hypothetical protein
MGRAAAVIVLACAASAAAQERVPPRILELVVIDRPADFVGARIDVSVIVEDSGAASIDRCDYGDTICAIVIDALARSSFAPATIDGRPVRARVRVAFVVHDPPPPPEPLTLPPNPYPEEEVREDAPAEGLGVVAEADRVVPIEGARPITLERAREIPGTFGDPFRAALLSPGVTPFVSLLPFFYLRGAPITGTIYYYDDLPLPAIYHVGAGPAVVHPRLVGDIQVMPGIAPARYGRHTGGVVVGSGPPRAVPTDVELEAELRLLDVNAYVRVPVLGGSIAAGGRFGYPALVLEAVDPTIQLDYGDYAVRADLPTVGDQRIQLVWVGSYDSIDMRMSAARINDQLELASTLQFHRGELRYLSRSDALEVGVAIRGGFDASELPDVVRMEAGHVGPRFWLRWREGPLTFRAGADAIATFGSLTSDNTLVIDRAPFSYYAESTHRTVLGAYAELDWRPIDELTIAGGVRTDAWLSNDLLEGAVDPRLRVTVRVADGIDLHAAVGVARMPAVFLLPLPGLSELPLRDGLQTAIQSEAGATLRGEGSLGRSQLAARVYVHHYDGLMFTDLTNAVDSDELELCDAGGLCREIAPDFRAQGLGYGVEVELSTDIGPNLWFLFTYTIGETEVSPLGDQVPFIPSYDVRHVFNAVLQWNTGAGFIAGVRGFLRSGMSDGFTWAGDDLGLAYYEQRLPWYGRLDASLAYAWDAGWARLRLGAEWMNVLFFLGGEPLGIDCDDTSAPPLEPCPVTSQPALFLPNLSFRGDL